MFVSKDQKSMTEVPQIPEDLPKRIKPEIEEALEEIQHFRSRAKNVWVYIIHEESKREEKTRVLIGINKLSVKSVLEEAARAELQMLERELMNELTELLMLSLLHDLKRH